MSMEQVAELGYFIISCIEKFQLDGLVGGTPQVWFIPDSSNAGPAEPALLDKLKKKAEKKLDIFKKNLAGI